MFFTDGYVTHAHFMRMGSINWLTLDAFHMTVSVADRSTWQHMLQHQLCHLGQL
jgi:hypothetical protein